MPDQYTRTRAQLGTPALDVLRRAHVAVFGIGGVGGQAVEVLARSGVGELSLFDSDTVALSNLNRQLVALHSTLGQYKVDAMAARIADIDPTIIVHANRMFYNAETAPDVDLTQFDYVLDCIDTVSAKLLLIRCCKKDGVPILCSMGAANITHWHGFKHPRIARYNAETVFALSDKEKDIIQSHMWPLTPTDIPHSREAALVCMADKMSSGYETVLERKAQRKEKQER